MVLVVDRSSLVITAASDNVERICGQRPKALIGTSLTALFPPDRIAAIQQTEDNELADAVPLNELAAWPPGQRYQVIVHKFAEEMVLEVEPRRQWPHPADYAQRLSHFSYQLEVSSSIHLLLQHLCEGLLKHFNYDRVIVLKIDQQGDMVVTQEARDPGMSSLLGVHYSHEITTDAERYDHVVNTVHNLANVADPLVTLHGAYGPAARELLRRHIACRPAREVSARFLKDSGLSTLGHLSILMGGELWGSVFCHSRRPVHVDYQMREFIRVIGRVAQQKLAQHTYSRTLRMRQAANVVRDRLLEHIANADNLSDGLTAGDTTLVDLLEGTHGAAICSDEVLTLFEITPTEKQVNAIMEWMNAGHTGEQEVYFTDQLSTHYAPAAAYPELAAGVLFLPLDMDANQWIMWFKPEVVQDIVHGDENVTDGERRFELRTSRQHGHSLPWTNEEVDTARALQIFIQDVFMKRYANTRRRNNLLRDAYEDLEAFSYTVGHDLRAPLRGIVSFAEILEEEYADALGEQGTGYLNHIRQNAERMRDFMNDLLALSQIDRNSMIVNELQVSDLVNRVLQDLSTSEDPSFRCVVQDGLPPIRGDKNHLITVFTNLLSNAVKYSAVSESPSIEVGHDGDHRDGHPVFYVADNGIGIPSDQQRAIFDLFSRSNNAADFKGSGIGLALVQRIITFHEGEIWLESREGEGTRFLFYTGV